MNKLPKVMQPPAFPGWWFWGAMGVSLVMWGGIIWGATQLF